MNKALLASLAFAVSVSVFAADGTTGGTGPKDDGRGTKDGRSSNNSISPLEVLSNGGAWNRSFDPTLCM